jgi:hypothetical protein
MACNSPFNIHYGRKSDVVQHSKTKQHSTKMLTFSMDRQLITTTMKPELGNSIQKTANSTQLNSIHELK